MKIFLLLAVVSIVSAQDRKEYDIVISGGRVMDPESGLDAIRNVGISGGKVAAITASPLTGKIVLRADGRVVAPGFIDIHSHGQTNKSNEYQAHDGVTTALELEVGVPSVRAYLEKRTGHALLNFGATASHGAMRAMALPEFAAQAKQWENSADGWSKISHNARYQTLREPEEFTSLAALMERGLREGGLGLGVATQYYPGASREEIFRVFQMGARWKSPIFTHVRSMTVDAMQEVLADAAATGTPPAYRSCEQHELGGAPGGARNDRCGPQARHGRYDGSLPLHRGLDLS